MDIARYKESIFRISGPEEFNARALDLFRYQYKNNTTYRQFVELLGVDHRKVERAEDIPFLPLRFFKEQDIVTGEVGEGGKVFLSSSTGGGGRSKHLVPDIHLYEQSFTRGFERFYGPVTNYRFLALLPSYLEQGDSSLVHMVGHFIGKTTAQGSGFYLHDMEALERKLAEPPPEGITTVLFGVTYALLDLAEAEPGVAGKLIVMETGGMKGRRNEMVREEVHKILKEGLGVSRVHSEYGMTELLSQAYSDGDGSFTTPPWMKIMIREMNDPLSLASQGRTGGINIIDLANIHSCGFLATQDLGRMDRDGTFEVLGRFDASDVRGCNLMYVT